jgi:hypothetical protein
MYFKISMTAPSGVTDQKATKEHIIVTFAVGYGSTHWRSVAKVFFPIMVRVRNPSNLTLLFWIWGFWTTTTMIAISTVVVVRSSTEYNNNNDMTLRYDDWFCAQYNCSSVSCTRTPFLAPDVCADNNISSWHHGTLQLRLSGRVTVFECRSTLYNVFCATPTPHRDF